MTTSLAPPATSILQRGRLAVATVVARAAIATVVLLVPGIIAGSAIERQRNSIVWIFTVVPHVGIVVIASVFLAMVAGLLLRLQPASRVWLAAHGAVIWLVAIVGVLLICSVIALDALSTLHLAPARPGSVVLLPLLAVGWILASVSLCQLPIFGSDPVIAAARSTTVVLESGVFILQMLAATPIVYVVVSVNLVVLTVQDSDPLLWVPAIVLACLIIPALFLVIGFVLGLPLRSIPPLFRFWRRYGEISLIGAFVSVIAIVIAWFTGSLLFDPAEIAVYGFAPNYLVLGPALVGLAFFLVNARIPIRRWRGSLVRRHPTAR
jgi:hypothetical protein